MRKGKKVFRIAVSVFVAVLMLAYLMPATGYATSGASFRVKNNNGPGGDHGYIVATYDGSSVTIERNETHTFTYAYGENSVRIDFTADADYQFDYYVIGNGSRHYDDNPSYFDARDYIYESGSNNTINLNPKWEHVRSYTIDTAASSGGWVTPDQTVSCGSDCTIVYSADAGYHISSVTVDGDDVTHSNPESYTFTNVTSDHSISVVFEPDIYTVTFSEGAHGGTTGTKTFTGLHYGDPFPAPPEITPEAGWTFDGWPVMPATVTGDASYTATYTQAGYTVTFDVGTNGATTDPTSFSGLHYGDAFPAAPAITPDPGWVFDQWTPALPSTVQGNGTYIAHYTQLKCTVTWNNWDGAQLEQDINVDYGTMPSYDGAEPVRPSTAQYDYTFSGWSPEVDTVTGDVTYTAQFAPALRSYTVTWNNWNGVQLEQDTEVDYGTTPSYDGAEPVRPSTAQYDYTFSGWSPAVDVVTGDVTYTAQFTPVLRSYTVTWNNWDGVQLEQDTEVDYGTTPSYDGAEPVRPGTAQYDYMFSGWSPAVDVVTGDVTYTAQFTPVLRSYTVTWNNWDGAQLEQDTNADYGTTPSYDGAEPVRPGTAQYDYTFSGWSPAVDTVTGDVTYTAQFTPALRSYTVTWNNWDGAQLEQDINADYGTMPSYDGAEPVRPSTAQYDYTFSGWSPAVDVVTGDVTYTAQFTPVLRSYTVTWNNWDGAQLEQDTNADYGTTPSYDGVEPVRLGTAQYDYTFSGWSPAVDTVTGDVTYTAQFTPVLRSYTVTWNNWDGVQLEQDTEVDYGTMPSYDGAEPVRPSTAQYDYTFSGWSPAVDTVTGDVTYTAQFTPALRSYTVTWNNWDGVQLEQDTEVDYGTMPSYDGAEPAMPSTAQYDYTFSGWSPAVDTVTGDVTYTAQFTSELRSYTVTFEDYDGTVLSTDTAVYGTGATAPADPDNRTGYHFTGWDRDFSNITGPLTVKAQYAINSYKVRFFRADGVTQIGTSQTVNWGSGASAETAPAIAGKTFSGWKLKGDDPSVATSLGNVKENIDAVAVYNAKLYPVTFVDFNGNELGVDNVPYGGDATPPSDPKRDGYRFTGWSQSYDNVTEDIICIAQYAINTYKVTFADYDGDVIDTQTVEWKAGASAPEDPARDGYAFTGWDVPFDDITKDTLVTAQYEVIATPSPAPTASPSPAPTASIAPEPVPQTGGGSGWLWWLLLIPVIGILWFIIAAKFAVVPIAEAFSDNEDGTYTVRWGYENRKNRKYKVEEDKSMISLIRGKYMKSSANPPVEFEAGRVENVFTTIIDKDAVVQWRINNRKAKVDLKKHQ